MTDDLDEFGEINVVPLVDVMLVLLTIVLTTATFVVNGKIPVDLAKSSTASQNVPTPLVLTLTADGKLYLYDKAIMSLKTALQGLDKSSTIAIRADGKIALEHFVSLSDDLKNLGFNNVVLEVKRQ